MARAKKTETEVETTEIVEDTVVDERAQLIADLTVLFREDIISSYDTELLHALRKQHIG